MESTNGATEKSTFDNFVLGGGLVAGAAVTIYKAIDYASETPTWLLLGTSASLFGVTLFAIVRSRSANSERELNLERVTNNAKSTASLELKQISQRIGGLSLLLPQPNNEQSVGEIQADYSSAYVLQQLTSFEEYLKSQKTSNSLAGEKALALQNKNTELSKELESAKSELLSKEREIKILSDKNNSQLEEIEKKTRDLDQFQKDQSDMQEIHRKEVESLKKNKEELESLQSQLLQLGEKNEEIEDLIREIDSNKLQWIVAQQTLGPLDQPVSIEAANKVRNHIINLLETPSKSRNNSAYSSTTSSAYSTPSKLNNNS